MKFSLIPPPHELSFQMTRGQFHRAIHVADKIAYQKFNAQQVLLVTSQTFTQSEFTLAGSLLNNAYQKYVLSNIFWS